jgi:drug/metabolite transporter (DMT)-like permease
MCRLSLAIPVGASIFLWGEKPLLIDIVGLLLIFLIILSWEGRPGRIAPLLIFLFFLFGAIDAAMKYFKLRFSGFDDSTFLIIVFYSAMVWSWIYILVSKQKIRQGDFLIGLGLGFPNFFSSFFLLKSLDGLPAYIVFPTINTGIIILSALFAYLLFKERLNLKKIINMILGILALVFLTA